jgi:hypothetical protein
MDRDQLIDLTPSEYAVPADSYTSTQRLAQDTAMLMASPQLVGYAPELPRPVVPTTPCGLSTTSACTASHA